MVDTWWGVEITGRIYVGISLNLRQTIIGECHNCSTGVHSGIVATVQQIKRYFYWPVIKQMVTEWIQFCDICQRCKLSIVHHRAYYNPFMYPLTLGNIYRWILSKNHQGPAVMIQSG